MANYARRSGALKGFIFMTVLVVPGYPLCGSHNDCSNSLLSLNNDRNYCCGGNFCCTAEQYAQGLRSDPFLSSAGAIIGIVVGFMVFCIVVGVIIWCTCGKSRKRKRQRHARRQARLEMSSYPGPYSDGSLPGYSTQPRNQASHDYAYPPDRYDVRRPTPMRDWKSDDTFTDLRLHEEQPAYRNVTTREPNRSGHKGSGRSKKKRNGREYSDGNVTYLGYFPHEGDRPLQYHNARNSEHRHHDNLDGRRYR